jgi:candicidin polyketide synthase FscB
VVLALAGGPASARTAALAAELVGLEVPVWSVDPDGLLGPVNQSPATSRGLARLLAQIGYPLTTVVHGAEATGATKETALSGAAGSIASLATDPTPATTPNPTAGAVHRLTQGFTNVHSFLILTDLTATLGASGSQASVEAAHLEALVAQRRADGLPATLVTWGPLTADGDAALTEAGSLTAPITGLLGALGEDDAAALLDLILERDDAYLVPARLTLARLRQTIGSASIAPPVWRALAGALASAEVTEEERSEVTEALKARLAELSPADAERTLLTMVRGHVAAVLGESSPETIDPRRAFSELGFDSMIAVELRNRLNTATGLKLPATAVFDYPSTVALTAYLLENLGPDGDSAAGAEEARLRRILATVAMSRFRDAGILDDLLRLADPEREAGNGTATGNGHRTEEIDELDAESLIALAMGTDLDSGPASEGADH